MTKRDFINLLAKNYDLPVNYSEKILMAVLDSIEDALFRDGNVKLPGIGSLSVRALAARQSRNPSTGETMTLPPSKKISFRPAEDFKMRLNTPTNNVHPAPDPEKTPFVPLP